jgi:phospholipid transport system substrate-binding protein
MKPIRSLLIALCCLPLLLPVAAGAASDDPRALVIDTTEKVLAKIREERTALDANPRLVDQFIIEIVLPHFDFEAMARLVLGKHWRRADAAQREAFVKEFRDLLVRTYATALLEYTEEVVEYSPLTVKPGDTEVTVRTEIDQPGGLGIPVHYRMERQEQGWKVYDVTIDGLSLIGNYRNTFANDIRSGSLDALIDSMKKRNLDARGG